MPRLMEREDLMRTAVDLGRAQEVCVMRVSTSRERGGAKKEIRYGLMKDKLKDWNYESDRALDEEVNGMFECLKENA